MEILGKVNSKYVSIADLFKRPFYTIPIRNRQYHSRPGRQKQLCQDLWDTTGLDGKPRYHYLNSILLLGDKSNLSCERRLEVLDAAGRSVGVLVGLASVRIVLSIIGQDQCDAVKTVNEMLTSSGKLDAEPKSRRHPRMVLQDDADACFQQWVIQCDTSKLFPSLTRKEDHSMVEQVLLGSLEESLDFFSAKVAAHTSVRIQHSQLIDDSSGTVTLQSLLKFCKEHDNIQDIMQEAAGVLEEFVARAPDRTTMNELLCQDQTTAWHLEETLNRPNEAQTGADKVRMALFRRYDRTESSQAQMKSVYERWCRLQALFDSQKPIAFWNCIVKLVQFHAAQHASTANPLTDDDDVLQYLLHEFRLVVKQGAEKKEYSLLDELHSEDPDSPAHAVARQFLDDWLEPFVQNYACVALVDDDARKDQLPSLIKNMSSRECNKMCLVFSYLAKQHKDFSPTGRWVEWVVPAIAFLFRFGKEAATPKLRAHTISFFNQLIRLSAYWLFCTTDETNYAQRRALASRITGQVLHAKDVADSIAKLSSWQLSSTQAQTFASSVETLAALPAQSIYQEGKPPMRNRQMLMLHCIELKEDANSELDRFPKAELEHIAPQGMQPTAWPKWDVHRDKNAIYQLGNLLPLNKRTNILASNHAWLIKRPEYKAASGSFLCKQFDSEYVNHEEWTQSMVASRTKQLSRYDWPLQQIRDAYDVLRVKLAWQLPEKQSSHVAAAEPQDDEEESLDANSVAAGQTAAFDAEQLPGQSLHADEGQSEAAAVASTPSSTSVVLPDEESPDHARLFLPYPLSGRGHGVLVTCLGRIIVKKGFKYDNLGASYVYPAGFTCTKNWKGMQFDQEIVDRGEKPGFKVTVKDMDGEVHQVEESTPLEAVKAILAAVNQAVPVSMTSKSRGTTSIHEWWGLHCSDDHGIRMCLELLPNAAQLLGKGLKFFKSGSHNPAGVRVTREQVPRAIPLIWPAWYQKEMDAVKALATKRKGAKRKRQNDEAPCEQGRRLRTTPAPRQGECEVSADLLAKWQDKLVANLVTDGAKAEEASKFVSTMDYTASKHRANKSVQWVMHDHVSAKRFKSSTEVRAHFKHAEVREQFKSAAPQTVGLY